MDGFGIGDFATGFDGIDTDIGGGGNFDMGFSEGALDDDVLRDDPRAPTLISNDFDEPADMFDIENQFKGEVAGQMAFKSPPIPKVTDSFSNIMGIGKKKRQRVDVFVKRIPKTDDEADVQEETFEVVQKKKRRKQRFRSKFEDQRFQTLVEGGAPISGEEALNFSRGRSFQGRE